MASDLLITVSGLRGVVGESLTLEVAARYVDAFLLTLPDGPMVVSRDGRANGPPVVRAIQELITSRGRECFDAGVASTPTVGILVRRLGAVGGVQVTASHNPAEYNGIKLFNATGRVIPAAEGLTVLSQYQNAAPRGTSPAAPDDSLVKRLTVEESVRAHCELVMSQCNADKIRSRKFRVVLDANFGSGALLGEKLLASLGCDVRVLGGEPTGRFAHPPEPTEANLREIVLNSSAFGADATFCQDPDADRLAVIDEQARYLGEEKTLALCVDHVLRSGRRGPVVTNCSTSRMTEDLATKYGVPFCRAKVGEANVVDLMLECEAAIGGEGNGGVIDPRVGLVRDSFVGMALILDAMAARDMPLSALADELPPYEIFKTTIGVRPEQVGNAIDRLERAFPLGAPDHLDGLRLDWPDGAWLLVRPSNTEPIVRIVAEAANRAAAESLCDEAAAVIKG